MPQRSLEESVEVAGPAWPIIEEWIAEARQTVETLTIERSRRLASLVEIWSLHQEMARNRNEAI
jgi:hypothetical protein